MSKTDPTKDKGFQKVVGHFLNTPPKPHKEMKKGKPKPSRAPASQTDERQANG